MIKQSVFASAIVAMTITVAAPATAQSNQKEPRISDRIGDLIDRPELTIKRDDEVETAAAAGCIISQTYNTQSVDDFSVQFRVDTSSGPEMFNVLVPNIKRANPSSFPLANAAQTLRWTRLLDTFERAAASDRPIRVSYEVASRDVFGITIEWNRRCAT